MLPSPFFSDSDTIRLLEPADCDSQAVLRKVVSGEYDRPFVIDDGSTRTLHFSLSLIQSTMSLKDPFALELDYTQAMMSFLLFLARPQQIFMLGLGGGSLAKFCWRHVGSARITVVEIDPDVIAFRDEFELPPDEPLESEPEVQAVRPSAKIAAVARMNVFMSETLRDFLLNPRKV